MVTGHQIPSNSRIPVEGPAWLGFPSTVLHFLPSAIPAAGPIRQVLALASVVTVALGAWGRAGEAALGAVDQVVALVATAFEVCLQCAHIHCREGPRGTWSVMG